MSGVIVDTCVWSLALKNKNPSNKQVIQELTLLINDNRANIIGLIRQEILSGYSDLARFEKLKNKLRAFPNEKVIDLDYESAAEYSNICRKRGVQGSHTDFLICAVSRRLKMAIYTTDQDFVYYSQYLPISLHQAR